MAEHDREIETTMRALAQETLSTVRDAAPARLAEDREFMEGFVARNEARWKPALDAIETLIIMVGEVPDLAIEWLAENSIDVRLRAVLQLHARAHLVAKEAVWLIRGGFADGSLSRWRSLHELAATARFIADADPEVAERFIASIPFHAVRRARAFNEHYTKDAQIEDAWFDQAEAECAPLRARYGDLSHEFAWAAPELSKGRARPIEKANFSQIEQAVAMEGLRPAYRMACDHVHAGPKLLGHLLGASEQSSEPYLTAPSNSGMADPLSMVATHLSVMAAVVLSLMPCVSGTVTFEAISDLAREVGEIAFRVQKSTLRAARWKERAAKRST